VGLVKELNIPNRVGQLFDCLIFVRGDLRDQRFCQSGKVSEQDRRLIAISIAPLGVDGAEHRTRRISAHKSIGLIIYGLAGDRHIVGVSHPADETDIHPTRHQGDLGIDDSLEKCQIGIFRIGFVGVVPRNSIIGKFTDFVSTAARREKLEGADADVVGRNAGENRAGQRSIPDKPSLR